MTQDLNSNVSTLSILNEIGFQSKSDGLQFDFGNCELKAFQGIYRNFQKGIIFLGFYASKRKCGELDFFLPLQVESYDEGLALISYYLKSADLKNKPDWLYKGLALSEHLPWKKEAKAYNEIPRAFIEPEWFRVLVNKLKLLISTSTDEDVTTFSFDGFVLKVTCNNVIFFVTALGKDWQRTFTLKTKSLDFLPKRILNKNISIYIWEDKLHIGNKVFVSDVLQ